MGRIRKDGTTKVWHNPEISGRRGERGIAPRPAPSLEERKTANAHRAALEALFAPKKEDDGGKVAKAIEAATGKPGRIVLAPPPQADPHAQDRQRLLGKLLGAEGRPAITKAANEFLKHGFTLPQEQDVYLQLLEHSKEDRVRDAIAALATILLGELPKRRAVLESRLRRIEEYAEDEATRTAATDLRRQVTGRGVAPSAKAAGQSPAQSPPPPEVVERAADTAETAAEPGEALEGAPDAPLAPDALLAPDTPQIEGAAGGASEPDGPVAAEVA